MLKVLQQSIGLAVEMNDSKAMFGIISLPCHQPAQCLVQLLGRRTWFKEQVPRTRGKEFLGLAVMFNKGFGL